MAALGGCVGHHESAFTIISPAQESREAAPPLLMSGFLCWVSYVGTQILANSPGRTVIISTVCLCGHAVTPLFTHLGTARALTVANRSRCHAKFWRQIAAYYCSIVRYP